MVTINPTLLIIVLHMNDINSPIKGQILLEWIKEKQKQTKNWTQLYQKKAGVAILFFDKDVFRKRKIITDEVGHYIMIKWSVLREDKTILNVYKLKRVSKHIRQK